MELDKVAAGVLSPLGYDVLETSLRPSGKQRIFLVRIERKDEVPIAVADLERASRVLGLELDRLDPIEGNYLLEVESPGAQRPLFTTRHFERFMGLKVKVRDSALGNFTGRIQMVREDEVDFLVDQETRTLKLGSFKANLAEWPETPR